MCRLYRRRSSHDGLHRCPHVPCQPIHHGLGYWHDCLWRYVLLTLVATSLICAVPLYQAELSTPTQRGRSVGFHGIALATGYALTGFIGFGCFYVKTSSFQWRFPFAVQLIPVLILLSGSWALPESPRWCKSYNSLSLYSS